MDFVDTSKTVVPEGVTNFHKFVETSAYRNNHCIWLLPTRGVVPIRVERSWWHMKWFMNTNRALIDIEKMEVGAAYEEGFDLALNRPDVAKFPWVWTYEEDNVQPMDVFHKLFGAIWKCIDCGADMPADQDGNPAREWFCPNGHKGLDGVSGLYFTKSDPPMPMCYGDPKSPDLEFRPRDISEAMKTGALVECNGIAQGCSLFRKDLFREVTRPWFKTVSGPDDTSVATQDLYFSRKAKEQRGARFAVHTGVIVGHFDVATGRMW